jgi:hypothetical protein
LPDQFGPLGPCGLGQPAEMRCDSAPAVQRSEQAVDSSLQLHRVVARVAGFAQCLIDDGVKRDDAADEFAAFGSGVGQLRVGKGEHAAKPTHDFGRKVCK